MVASSGSGKLWRRCPAAIRLPARPGQPAPPSRTRLQDRASEVWPPLEHRAPGLGVRAPVRLGPCAAIRPPPSSGKGLRPARPLPKLVKRHANELPTSRGIANTATSPGPEDVEEDLTSVGVHCQPWRSKSSICPQANRCLGDTCGGVAMIWGLGPHHRNVASDPEWLAVSPSILDCGKVVKLLSSFKSLVGA